ncbi:hypothetical protein [Sphingomonas sp. PWP1-2]|uniref:hypothetical protein n=1 Tax=Sphingomonas sp. PWP1-2 TaxID=2804558 RepID=UPI003CE7F568
MTDYHYFANPGRVVLIRDSALGFDVLVTPEPTCDDQDSWFAALSDARHYAAGLSAGTGWRIADHSTETSVRAALRKAEPPAGGLMGYFDKPPFRGMWGRIRHRR